MSGKPTRLNHTLTLDQKVQIVKDYKAGLSHEKLMQKFKLSKYSVEAILDQKHSILGAHKRNLNEAGTKKSMGKPFVSKREGEINDEVYKFYQRCIQNDVPLSGAILQERAAAIADKLSIKSFEGNSLWLRRFIMKFNIDLDNSLEDRAVNDEQDVQEEYLDDETEAEPVKQICYIKTEFIEDHCRLCGANQEAVTMGSLDDDDLMIKIKLEKVFKYKLNDDKMLSQFVCIECISKLENSLAFLEAIEETDKNLIQKMNEQVDYYDASFLFQDDIKMEEVHTETKAIKISSSPQKLKPTRKRAKISSVSEEEKPSNVENRWNGGNPVLRVEDIFEKELTQGIYTSKPDQLDLADDEKNSDGTLNEAGKLKMSQRNRTDYVWKCGDCNIILPSSADIKEHYKILHKRKKVSYACNECQKPPFKCSISFQNHVIENHRPVVKFLCDFCGEFRWNLVDLFRHRSEKHPKFRNMCIYCGKLFQCGFNLKMHTFSHLPFKEDEMYECDQCGFSTRNKRSLKQHLHQKHIFSEYICETCGKIFKRSRDVDSHQLVHSNERPYACCFCELKFKCPKQLKCHKKLHFPRELKEECLECGKKFANKTKLTRHSRVHKDEYEFTCDYCGRKFKHTSGFATHRRIHTGERPYLCSFQGCGQKFIDWPNMNKHMKNKHSIDNSSRKKTLIVEKKPTFLL